MEQKNDLISVIIPVYNVEDYLRECLNSIINQTYQNLEIILIDDGSTDGSGKICEDYAKNDNRIKVIHKPNGGLSEARNCGIDNAKGRYLVFVDSDDYVSELYIKKLYKAIQKYQVKLAECNISIVNEVGKQIEEKGYLQELVKSGTEMIQDLCLKHKIENTASWNKMYAIELFENIKYPVGKIHEDEFTTYKIMYLLENVAIINEALYFYRQREGSITKNKYSLKRLDSLQAMEEKLNFFKEKNEKKLYQLSMEGILRSISFAYVAIRKDSLASKEFEKELIQKYRKYFKEFWKFENIEWRIKIKRMMFFISPQIFYVMQTKIRKKE